MAVDDSLRDLVWLRASGRCEYCQMSSSHDPLPFEVDHIIATQHLGPTEQGNLALACFACNRAKGPNIAGFDPVSKQTVPLFHPRREVWSEHFEWNGAELQGVTAVGRVTVVVLAVNRDHRVALRRALIDEGVFPL